MGYTFSPGSFDDPEAQKRAATQRRFRALAIVLMLTVGARIIFRNPPPPKSPDHRDRPFRAIPGILNSLPAAERSKLTPTQLALLQEADRNAAAGLNGNTATGIARNPNMPLEKERLADTRKFAYSTHKEERWAPPAEVTNDNRQNTVVAFRRGGFILAEDASRTKNSVEIRIDNTMLAKLPSKTVTQIFAKSPNWTEPIPLGHVMLKPAHGITIVVASRTAKRISITKRDEKAI